MSEQNCKSCVYWKQNDEVAGGQVGWCQRFPPRPIWIDSPNMPGAMPGQTMKPDVHSFMPAVHAEVWCGEFSFKGSGKAKTKGKKQ